MLTICLHEQTKDRLTNFPRKCTRWRQQKTPWMMLLILRREQPLYNFSILKVYSKYSFSVLSRNEIHLKYT